MHRNVAPHFTHLFFLVKLNTQFKSSSKNPSSNPKSVFSPFFKCHLITKHFSHQPLNCNCILLDGGMVISFRGKITEREWW